MPEQSQGPTRIPAGMADPVAQEDKPAVHVVAVGPSRTINARRDLFSQLGWNPLVGVYDQHPFITKRKIFERPVFLFVSALVLKLDHVGARLLRQASGAVGRL